MIPFQSLFTLAENPIVQTIYTADPAPMVDGDTLYVYTCLLYTSARAVQLGDDMISIVGEPVEIDAPRLFEDSGMHKYNGIYYYSYCSNFSGQSGEGYPPTGTIAYMVSKSPLGPVSYTHLYKL